MLNEDEKKWLNNYHKKVYNKLSPYLNEEEKELLKEETRKYINKKKLGLEM